MQSTLPRTAGITALILAGGQGRRLGGSDKGLVAVDGAPLVERVAARIAPQVDRVLISANRNLAAYRRLGWPVVQDEPRDFPGPLAGMLAGLEACEGEWLAVVPCDTPDLPRDLITRLATADADIKRPRVVLAGGKWQPVICLLHRGLANDLRSFIAAGGRKVMDWLQRLDPVAVQWPDADPFRNLNTAEDLTTFTARNGNGCEAAPAEPGWVGDAPVIGVAAGSGTGKTTLLEATLPHLVASGLRVALVKHAHHDFDIDKPGKDSHRLRQAGACQVVVGSARRIASIIERPDVEASPGLAEFLARIDPSQVDLVLVEGFKRDPIPRLALRRREAPEPLVPLDDPWLVALATDEAPDTVPGHLAVLDINDPAAVAAFLIGWRRMRRLSRLEVHAP
jgi:molybdopterin-guanine dinucleotide biosynthesis protein